MAATLRRVTGVRETASLNERLPPKWQQQEDVEVWVFGVFASMKGCHRSGSNLDAGDLGTAWLPCLNERLPPKWQQRVGVGGTGAEDSPQ